MGCCAGKAEPPKPRVYDPTPDPITGLTQKDRDMIVESWNIVGGRNVIKQHAVEYFLMLFAAYPYTQNYFGLFKSKELSELKNSPKMRVHAATVFYYVAAYVENIEDSETLMGLIEKMAISHIGRGITVEEFEKIRIVFHQFFPSVLHDKYTPELEAAWDKLLKAQSAVFILLGDELSSEGDDGDSGDS